MMPNNTSTYLAVAYELLQLLNLTSLKQLLVGYGVTWQFIPRGSWHGEFRKRLVGSTK